MIVTGILLGPYGLNWLSPALLNIAAELRQLALVLILPRAGLALDLNDLKRVGRPAILLCFVPAAVKFWRMSCWVRGCWGCRWWNARSWARECRVSPAVIVPRMLKLEEKRGTGQSVPQMIMAGASADDVFVIVLFPAFLA